MDLYTLTLNDWGTIIAIIVSSIGLIFSSISLFIYFKSYKREKGRSEPNIEIEIENHTREIDSKKNFTRLRIFLNLKNRGGVPTEIEKINIIINNTLLKDNLMVSKTKAIFGRKEYIGRMSLPFQLGADKTLSLSIWVGLSKGKDNYVKKLKEYKIIINHTHGEISKIHRFSD